MLNNHHKAILNRASNFLQAAGPGHGQILWEKFSPLTSIVQCKHRKQQIIKQKHHAVQCAKTDLPTYNSVSHGKLTSATHKYPKLSEENIFDV